jgi:Zn-dependent membrane protease YugP
MDIGLVLFAGAVAFTVVTLPVEFNASNRAVPPEVRALTAAPAR